MKDKNYYKVVHSTPVPAITYMYVAYKVWGREECFRFKNHKTNTSKTHDVESLSNYKEAS